MNIQSFGHHWALPLIGERSQFQTFLIQLCAQIGVPAPDAERTSDPDYCFERRVGGDRNQQPGRGFIDCYRRGSLVMEAKKASGHAGADAAPTERAEGLMRGAKRQAERYAWALDEWPPFLIIVDVGRSIELWSDFARQGKAYLPFPDSAHQKITLDQLNDPAIRTMLAAVWMDPMSLDPANRVAQVTTDIAERLGWLVRSIGSRGPDPTDQVSRSAYASKTALFVMQCIFAMFADSVGLIGRRGFLELLTSYRGCASRFHIGAESFFRTMHSGGHCAVIRQDIPRFNGGLYREVATIAVTDDELEALIAAAQRDWTSVEPAIFGSLLEGALDARERTELGAHYTPRAFVERLVEPTVIEPLRADWETTEAYAIGLYLKGEIREAQQTVRRFHTRLCQIRVLDPACGTGNFLYVAMGMMKALEGEVLGTLVELGDGQAMLEMAGHSVSSEQFVGMEKNQYAAWIAQMVLWIGHLQWQFRTFGDTKPAEPILKDATSIWNGDAILSWDKQVMDHDATARRVAMTRAAGLFEGDDAREVTRFVNPRPTPWPEADFIVGNPPFMGAKDMRRELGDGYVDALWAIRQGRFRSADLVTVWWDRAAEILVAPGSRLRRFGFITTNSLTQTFSRRVLERHLSGAQPVRIVFAIADHPWVKGEGRAAVRVAMSVAERGEADGSGRLGRVVSEAKLDTETPEIVIETRRGDIGSDLSLDLGQESASLRANADLCARGVQLMGAGFAVTTEQALDLFARSTPGWTDPTRPYRNGRDLADRARDLRVIDFFGLTETEARRGHPGFYQHLLETVKIARDRNNRASYRANWWLFGEPRRELRAALEGLPRYIVTVETAKHRWFRFQDAEVMADNKLVVVASDSPTVLGILSSSAHAVWFGAHCGRIGVYDADAVYVKGACFDAFPFPDLTASVAAEIGALAEELNEARDLAISRCDGLTMTTLYNLRDRKRSNEPLTPQENRLFEAGGVGIIDHLHDRLDRCVQRAYGWADQPDAQQVLARLRALNITRTLEEAQGQIRYIRPEFQHSRRSSSPPVQIEADLRPQQARRIGPLSPEHLATVVLTTLRHEGQPLQAGPLIGRLGSRRTRQMQERVADMLAILSAAGAVRHTDAGWFAPRRPD